MRAAFFVLCYFMAIHFSEAQCAIEGRLFDRNLKIGLSSIEVKILGWPNNNDISTLPDSLGKYHLDSIPEGKWSVLFHDYDGLFKDTVVKSVAFSKGKTIHLDINYPLYCEYDNIAKACPTCKDSSNVIPIHYGLPTLEMEQQYREGKISLGGCTAGPCRPHWYCKRHMKRF
jgi:hypothetical protein